MLKFIQYLVSPAGRRSTQPTTHRSERHKHEAWDSAKSIRGLEVLEGNEDSDWDLWQCSVDSQLQPLTGAVRTRASVTASQFDDFDPFARVTKNSDL